MKTKTWLLTALLLTAPLPVLAQDQAILVSGSALSEPNIYVAEEGDSLWDIADRFFNDPWYWPTLWSFNPHITNPNWIFPGDLVYLVPPSTIERPQEGLSVTESRYAARAQVEAALGRRVGFISEDKHKGSGEITNSREERLMLAERDETYIRFNTARKVKVGDLFLVYRVEDDIDHPVTDDRLGYRVRYLGVVKVISTEKALNKAVLVRSFLEIERGDRVAPYAPVQRLVPPVRNAAAVAGNIVDTFDAVEMLGEYYYAVIDRGTKHGVTAGNRFILRERGDGRVETPKKKMDDFPYETYGEVLIIDPQEQTSLGIVTYSNHEISIGAPCDMMAGY